MPIKKKSVVQTGAKIQFGGFRDGLVRVLYQVGIAGAVNIEPSDPITSLAIIKANNSQRLNFLTVVF